MLMHSKHGSIRFGWTKQWNLLVVLGRVEFGPNVSTCDGLVGLGQSADGLGWTGSHNVDPWTTLWRPQQKGKVVLIALQQFRE